ncbi:hypothetical protein [Nitrosomonas sp. HPC101]|uniref:hypothetical protein n=1 Tax=Nitrosomonas sp. HPC101 TaxID=1658667 RepID=UPI0013685B1E|nr:hypothetical protein [Nitrosomonas sp. HPC101]
MRRGGAVMPVGCFTDTFVGRLLDIAITWYQIVFGSRHVDMNMSGVPIGIEG